MKVLIISHNCISSNTNMGKTICSLFSEMEPQEICQIYVSDDYPENNTCSSCYRITDKNALHSIFFRKKCGEKISVQKHLKTNSTTYNVVHSNRKKSLVRIFRDFIWFLSAWYSNDLKNWIEEEKPDCIFLIPGYAKFIYNIALKINKKFNIPILTYICDDYYFTSPPNDFCGKIYLTLLKNKIAETLNNSCFLISICEEIKILYENFFNIGCAVCMTGSKLNNLETNDCVSETISFFGNISNNRYKSIAELAQELYKKFPSFSINVYTSHRYSEYFDCLNKENNINLKDFVSEAEMINEMKNSICLLHVEAFDEENINLVKHSISTKIADSLASGIPLIAYAPENISSVKHLIRNNCAFIATSKEALGCVLVKAISDKEARARIITSAITTAETYHRNEKNSKELRNIIGNIINEHRHEFQKDHTVKNTPKNFI